ncbi:MAG: hypothetical protein QG657_5120, partial [Acidobacteriota bacterium]|nr:hypothetical protein [Acidobacteriota bacterium]
MSKGFWHDLQTQWSEIKTVTCSAKQYSIENELTKFRYDALLEIKKTNINDKNRPKFKYQDDMRCVSLYAGSWHGLNISSVTSGNLAYIIYTSGSTGQPKGVMIEHRSLVNVCHWHNTYYSFTSRDRATRYAGFGFDASVCEFFPSLLVGAAICIIPEEIKLDVGALNHYYEKNGVTLSFLPPQMAELFMTIDNTSLRFLEAAGDRLTKFIKRNYQLVNCYGPTEDTVCTTAYPVMGMSDNIPIGKPVSNNQVYIMDSDNNLQPVGVPGELCIGGDGLARGYLNKPELTREAFEKAPLDPPKLLFIHHSPLTTHQSPIYKTGDLARYLIDGNIEFLGRIDQQVKIRGIRIELAEIENRLRRHEDITEAVVLCKKEIENDKYLCAYIVANKKMSISGLKEYLAKYLPTYMIPAHFSLLEKLPLTASGKIDRKALDSMKSGMKERAAHAAPRREIEKKIADIWKEVLKLDDVGIFDNFFDLGGNSLNILTVNNKIKKAFERDIPVAKMFTYSTIHSLANYIHPDDMKDTLTGKMEAAIKDSIGNTEAGLEVAVIGMVGRFPGAKNITEFWNNLKNGVESITFFSDEELEKEGVDLDILKKPDYVKASGILEGIEYFDASFFGYTPREAEIMNPEMRFFHECAWEALEDAGYNPESYDGLIGVYAGASSNFLWEGIALLAGKNREIGDFAAGHLACTDFITTMISYKLNLKGPSSFIQTACSTSLVAIHYAYRSLLSGECHMALAGGVKLNVKKQGYLYQEGMVSSPDGHCRAFDAQADGTVSGSGIGIVVLKRLKNAIVDRDNIYVVIKGSAINNDGSRKVGYAAPGVLGQAEVIRQAQSIAHVEPVSIGYIETHGTATPLGDSIEIEALTLAFQTEKRNYCPIGSVKTNIGHLDAAAGVAGFIKTVLCLKNKQIPPSLHFKEPNPKIDFKNSPFYVNNRLAEWKRNDYPRRAGVSSFGIGGTNAHVILEEWPLNNVKEDVGREFQLVLLSAKTQRALDNMTGNLAAFFNENRANPALNFSQMAYTVAVGRKHFEYRRMMVCKDIDDAITVLSTPGSRKVLTFFSKEQERPVIFMFPGLGSQYVNMGRGLFETEPVFRDNMNHCFKILKSMIDYDIKEILYPAEENTESQGKINDFGVAQLVIFIFEYALAQLMGKWGITPTAMIGYSFGEYVSACLAGVFSLADALKLIVSRGKLISCLVGGVMLSVPLPKEELIPILNDSLAIAIDNGPSCIIAGPREAVDALQEQLKTRRCMCMPMDSSYAIHSKMMAPVLTAFTGIAGEIKIDTPRIPYISNLTGTWITADDVYNPSYWSSHLSQTVRFAEGIKELLQKKNAIFIEVGPGRDLTALVGRYFENSAGDAYHVVNLVKPVEQDIPDIYYLLNKIGHLWLYGVKLNWEEFYAQQPRGRISLPTYPFERQYYWIEINSLLKNIDQFDISRDRDLLQNIEGLMKPGSLPTLPTLPTLTSEPHLVDASSEKQYTQFKTRPGLLNPYSAPRNDIEETLTQIWQGLTGFEQIGIDDNFFDLGGDSLKGINLISRIHKELNVRVSLPELFNKPTVRTLAEMIEKLAKSKYSAVEPSEKKEYYPLSPAQKRLYILHQLDEQGLGYNLPFYFLLTGELNKDKFADVFRRLIARYDILRTTFHMINNEPAQWVHDEAAFEIETEVLGGPNRRTLSQKGSWPPEAIIKSFIRPFDLSKTPLLRVGLLKIEKDKHILMVDMHHIVSDGVSINIIANNFMTLYQGNELPEVRIQYKDFAEWRCSQNQEEFLKQQEDFWLNEFDGEIPLLDLPVDYARPAFHNFEGSQVNFEIDPGTTGALKALISGAGDTLFMVLLAIYTIFLAKITNQEEIVVGSPTAGRRHADLEQILGMFVNTLAFRNYPNGEKTFSGFLQEIKEKVLKAFENQDYQYEDLVEKVVKTRDVSRNPLFDTFFAWQNFGIPAIEIPGLTLTDIEFENKAAQFDLALNGNEVNGRLFFVLDYSVDLFKRETIERFSAYYKQVIHAVVKDIDIKLSAIEIIPYEEKQHILAAFNNTAVDLPEAAVHQLIDRQAQQFPHADAVVYKDRRLSYAELKIESDHFASALRQKNLESDQVVAVLFDHIPEMLVTLIGILKAGAAYLPIAPDIPLKRIEYIIRDSGAKCIITQEKYLDSVGNCRDNVLLYSQLMDNSLPLAFVPLEKTGYHPHHLAYIIYTSGSTGTPKGVMIEQRSFCDYITWAAGEFEHRPGYQVLLSISYASDASLQQIFPPLISGGTLHLIDKELRLDVSLYLEYIKEHKINKMDEVPAMMNEFLAQIDPADPEEKLPDLTCLSMGNEYVPIELVKKCRKHLNRSGRIINAYGPTETSVEATSYHFDGTSESEESLIGKPRTNTRIYILDKGGNCCPVGIKGEICIAGVGLARGYINNPELTRGAFGPQITLMTQMSQIKNKSFAGVKGELFQKLPLVYHTGDLGCWLPDGNIRFLGRIDDQIKIRGYRVELSEIERVLKIHEMIKDSVVIIRKDEEGNNELCAYYVIDDLKKSAVGMDITHLRRYLEEQLPSYMVPSHLVELARIPLTPNGKVDKQALPEPGLVNLKPGANYAAPADEIEKLVAATWKEVLKASSIGTNDNFFDLGGNSIKIIQVNNKLSGLLKIKIPVVKLFEFPTVSGLSRYLKEQTTGALGAPGIPVQLPAIKKEALKEKFAISSDIAVIGMAGRFPGARNIREFWENLKDGTESISFFSNEELVEEGISSSLLENKDYIKAKGNPLDKERFDAAFFNYAPQEAMIMDPQVRMFHECVWETLEDAGYTPDNCDETIGLFAGAANNIGWEAKAHLYSANDSMNPFASDQLIDFHFLPNQIAYKLNLKGPAVFVHTACSTSLAAIHMACNALFAGDCVMALSGGVTLLHEKKGGYMYQEGLVMSPDGHCRAFDAKGCGTVVAEGAASVLLKPFEAAIADRDHIYAVVKASASNNDGSRKVGFSAPSVEGQAQAIAAAYRKAGIPPESITYIETHGTGTKLGDPIELEALRLAFNTQKKGFCAIGSVKTNVGHTDCAAGAVSFVKTVLALKYKQIPPTLHFETPNMQIDLIDSPFYLNTHLKNWEPGAYPLRAGVSSLGIGGTNVHVILEEYASGGQEPFCKKVPALPKTFIKEDAKLILVSAKTPTALEKMKANLLAFLKINKDIPLADVAYTLQRGRKIFDYKWMALCSTIAETIAALDSPGTGEIPNWQAFIEKEIRNRVSLPTYPFEGQPYWIDGNPFNINYFQQASKMSQSIRKNDIADWFYFPRWIQSSHLTAKKSTPLCFLAFINECSPVMEILKQLRFTNVVITVKEGHIFEKQEAHDYTIDSQNAGDYTRLLNELKQAGLFPERIIHFWNVTEKDCQWEPGFIGNGFYSLLYLAKAIGKQDFSGEIRLDVVTTNIQEITGNETLIPEKAVILGPLKVIPQEYPFIVCRSIDIELSTPGTLQEKKLLDCLVAEFTAEIDFPDADIAYRGYYRWIKTYEPTRLESPGLVPVQLKYQGVYLITGGYGNIGFTFAEYLARQVRAKLILTGPSPLPAREEWNSWLQTHDADDPISRKIENIRQLESLGGKVLVLTADVADKDAMERGIQKAEETFGTINGFIHAAGTTRGKSAACSIEETTKEECTQQFKPKIQGTLVLAELIANKTLDFCILLSSLSQILGGLGFGAYSAANAFMDVFAFRANRTSPTRWISVNWADWIFKHELEIMAQASMEMSAAREIGITPDEGVETFIRILGLVPTGVNQVAVSAGDFQARIERWVKLRSLRKSDSLQTPDAASFQLQARPKLSTEYAAPRTPLEKAIAETWKNQLGYEKIGIYDDFFQLGGDSLKAITLISRIHKDLNTLVKLQEFFANPTVESLAGHIGKAEKGEFVSIAPVEKKEYYAMSSTQRRLFTLGMMEHIGTGYNLTLINRLQGKLDREKLAEVFKTLIKRHESFRTSFLLIEGKAVQRVHEEVEFKIETEVLGGPGTLSQKGSWPPEPPGGGSLLKFIRPFDLSQAPLMRVGIIKIEEEEHILITDIHHIIFDGVSLTVFLNEFVALYHNQPLPSIGLQYKDYSEWQNLPGWEKTIKKQETYWLNTLSGELPVLEIPTDYSRPVVQSFEGGVFRTEIAEKEAAALNEIARSEGGTLFMILLGILNVFLARISGQEDILVGVAVAGRSHDDLRHIIGMFVNTLVMRNFPASGEPFRQFFQGVKKGTLEAFENQDYPFEYLVEKLVKEKDFSRNPLFDVMFVLQGIYEDKEESPGPGQSKEAGEELKLEDINSERTSSAFDLSLEAVEVGGKLRLAFGYC